MKTDHKNTILFLLVLFIFPLFGNDFYFYSHDRKIPLTISEDVLFVKFKSDLTDNQNKSIINQFVEVKEIQPSFEGFSRIILKNKSEIPNLIEKLRSKEDVLMVNPQYLFKNAEKIVTDKFSVQFKEDISFSKIEEINKENKVEIVTQRPGNRNLFVLRITPQSNLSTLETANFYKLNDNVVYALPSFFQKYDIFSIPNDLYFPEQYYLHNTGQTGGTNDADIDAPEAWDITTGSPSITVAVIDQGVQSHEDLPASRLVSGWDYGGSDPNNPHNPPDNDPSPDCNEAHGMSCAGIIAASHNNIGISGIAPECKIMPIKVTDFNGFFTENYRIALAIDYAWQNGADVLSNSWGFTAEGDWDDDIEAAINRALSQGRDPDGSGPLPAKGCVVVFAAGNSGFVSFPAIIQDVLSVGASNKNNNIWGYSGKGNMLDIVAPSGNTGYRFFDLIIFRGDVWSTDIPELRGYNDGFFGEELGYQQYDNAGGDEDGYYLERFGGTSAAAPQASGVAALILSEYPDLNQGDVVNSIISTADDLGFPSNEQGEGKLNAYKSLSYIPYLGIPPAAPFLRRIQKYGNHPKLTWPANTEPDLAGYKIERREGLTGPWLMPTGGNLPASATSFVDMHIFILENNPDRVYYRMRAYDEEGLYSGYSNIQSIYYNSFPKVGTPEDSSFSGNDKMIPYVFELSQNFPNPFNPSTKIPFSLPESQHVSITIYSIAGKKVITLVDNFLDKGYHTANWEGRDENGFQVSSGLYIYELKSGDMRFIKKMLFIQ